MFRYALWLCTDESLSMAKYDGCVTPKGKIKVAKSTKVSFENESSSLPLREETASQFNRLPFQQIEWKPPFGWLVPA